MQRAVLREECSGPFVDVERCRCGVVGLQSDGALKAVEFDDVRPDIWLRTVAVTLDAAQAQCETPVRLMSTFGDVLMRSGRVAVAATALTARPSEDLSNSLIVSGQLRRRGHKKCRDPWFWPFLYPEERRDDKRTVGFAAIGHRLRDHMHVSPSV